MNYYQEGMQAALNGLHMSNNPYLYTTDARFVAQAIAWLKGYERGHELRQQQEAELALND